MAAYGQNSWNFVLRGTPKEPTLAPSAPCCCFCYRCKHKHLSASYETICKKLNYFLRFFPNNDKQKQSIEKDKTICHKNKIHKYQNVHCVELKQCCCILDTLPHSTKKKKTFF